MTIPNITLDNLIKKYGQVNLYKAYDRNIELGKLINSPLRKDSNPSFAIFKARTGQILFKDHGTGECGNIVKFASIMSGLSNYNEILLDIYNRVSNKQVSFKHNNIDDYYTSEAKAYIQVVRQNFTLEDAKYWLGRYNISEQTLNKYNVNSIKHCIINGKVWGTYSRSNPMYSYKIFNSFKIYRPLADKMNKWRSNATNYDIQGFQQLPKQADTLVITKSLKDVMVLHEMGVSAISPSSESSSIPKEILNYIDKNFKNIFILYDRDEAGVLNARKLSNETGYPAFFINKKFCSKDLSDAVRLNSFESMEKWVHKTIENERKRTNFIRERDNRVNRK